jgi:small subunit ribosomal protein S9
MFNESFFGITPKSFKSIDIDLSRRESLRVIHPEMPISTEHKRIIAFRSIDVNNTVPSYSLYSKVENRFCFKKLIISPISSNNSHSYKMNSLKNCGMTKFNLLSDLPGRDLKFKELKDPKPLLIRDPESLNPSSSKISKGVSTSATPISFTTQAVNFIAPTSYAGTTVVFPTQPYKEKSCSIFAPDKAFLQGSLFLSTPLCMVSDVLQLPIELVARGWMESFITLLALFLLVTGATVIACLAIYNRKRQQQTLQKVEEEALPTVTEEQPTAAQEPQPSLAQEVEPIVVEETPLTPVEEARPVTKKEAQPPVAEMQPTALAEAELTKAQDAQTIAEKVPWATVQVTQETVPDEAQPPIIEEIQTLQADETQVIGAEETQAIATKDTEPTAKEQTQPQGAEKVQPKSAEEPEVEVKTGPREPIKRGGRPRGSTPNVERAQTPQTKPRHPKPEIICRRRERQWVLAVEPPEELLESPDLKILQNGSALYKLEWGCWRLEHVFGEVVVRWSDEGTPQETKIELGQERYLLFKLVGQDLDQGRLVRSLTAGSYLVVVPDNWERDEALSGQSPVMPQPMSLPGYKAHFFDLDKSGDQKIAFRLPDGKQLIIKEKVLQFELIGRQLTDASEYMGPLFGEEPPQIRASDAQVWKGIKKIVIWEESKGRGRWRKEFSPNQGQKEQDLPSELKARRSGWYSLRFYDADDNLLESLDFRFIAALKKINAQQLSPLPSADGHKAVLVEFIHESDCILQPLDTSTKIKIEGKPDRTILTIPPDPTYDLSRWSVCSENGPAVEVVVLVERIWWALAEEGNAPSDSDWTDKLLELSREDFAATSNKALWLRLPKRRWVDKVLGGFERSKARAYKVKVEENTVIITLRDYGDSPEVENKREQYPFRVWFERGDRVEEGVVAILRPSQPAQCWVGFGRKKNAVAKAVIYNGDGEIRVNGEVVNDYFAQAPQKAKRFLERLINLEEVQKILSKMDVNFTVMGSSPTTMQQPKAVAHAIARALMNYDPKLKPLLRQAGFGGVKVK